MGRNGQPIALHLAKGNPNRLTKSEITRREKSEVKLGDNKLKCPEFIKSDVIAYAKWKEIVKIYKDIDFVSSGDVGILARYCMTFSEYHKLLKHRINIDSVDFLSSKEENEMEKQVGEDFAERLINKVNYIISVDGVLKIDTAINKKMDMLIKMEDRIFLTPLAKIKSIPKKTKEPENPLKKKGFGNV